MSDLSPEMRTKADIREARTSRLAARHTSAITACVGRFVIDQIGCRTL